MRSQRKIFLRGEPNFGSIYDKEEIRTINKLLKESIDPSIGFIGDKETMLFEKDFCNLCNCKYAIALNGAGSAIDLVLKTLNIKKGDEIISCAINFPGTHLAIIGSGAKLILVEPVFSTLNIDPCDINYLKTQKLYL